MVFELHTVSLHPNDLFHLKLRALLQGFPWSRPSECPCPGLRGGCSCRKMYVVSMMTSGPLKQVPRVQLSSHLWMESIILQVKTDQRALSTPAYQQWCVASQLVPGQLLASLPTAYSDSLQSLQTNRGGNVHTTDTTNAMQQTLVLEFSFCLGSSSKGLLGHHWMGALPHKTLCNSPNSANSSLSLGKVQVISYMNKSN